ncbi:MAG: sulfite exporter TauE/SafE family protein [Hyphomicrobiaceae bacterium]|nr:sulfite exporter TauE/SafE family protein [Hyphomicrobiaceae bacterium]
MFGLSMAELGLLAVSLIGAGAVTGILAGLFGVGGGAVMVPVLYEVFGILGVDESVRMPLCVGTSLAVIIPTSIRSFRGHKARGAVDMDVLKAWALPIVLGVAVGALIARYAEPWVFMAVFVVVAGVNAIKLLFGRESWRISDTMPGKGLMNLYGAIIGVLSSLMGIGGGVLSNMVMTFYGAPIHRSVATSSGVGVLISIPGALGYIYAGWPQMPLLPPLSLGFVSLIGFALLIPTTVLFAPLGVRIAHALEKRRLEIAFGLFLILVALRFAIRLATL